MIVAIFIVERVFLHHAPRKPHPIGGETERFNSVGPGNRNFDDALPTCSADMNIHTSKRIDAVHSL